MPLDAGVSPSVRQGYLSSLTLRHGRSANHQTLAMVARTPKAAAGLAILRERSDMERTLPGVPVVRTVDFRTVAKISARLRKGHRYSARWNERVGTHVVLLNFFAFSYLVLAFFLRATRTMGDMQRTTFRTSPTERLRRRIDGPALTMILGTGGASRTSVGGDRPPHPAQDGFTPDGVPGDSRDFTVHDSEPGPSPVAISSRGSATLDRAEVTSTGSGPNGQRGQTLQLIAEFLEQHVGSDRNAAQVTVARHLA